MSRDPEQSPFAALIAEYERLWELAIERQDADDDEGRAAAFDQVARVRELIFATQARTPADAAAKLRFVAQIAQEMDGDISSTGAREAILDVARFIESSSLGAGAPRDG